MRLIPLLLPALLALLLAGCGFHLRREAALPPGLERVHVAAADPAGPLARDLGRALERSGAELVKAAPDAAVLRIHRDQLATDVLSVGTTARANEYALRYHVEFELLAADGSVLVPRQVIELSRSFTFDSQQALGLAAETDLLAGELQRDMVQAILRRLEARSSELRGGD